MLYSLEQLKQNLVKVEHHLLYHMITELQENNRLLREMSGAPAESDDREELMKKMSEVKDKPRGWHKWSDDKMIKFLKEAS